MRSRAAIIARRRIALAALRENVVMLSVALGLPGRSHERSQPAADP